MNSRQNQLQASKDYWTLWMICVKNVRGTRKTMQTLRHLTIEETYELGDAIWTMI
jgi:hypothetical protein